MLLVLYCTLLMSVIQYVCINTEYTYTNIFWAKSHCYIFSSDSVQVIKVEYYGLVFIHEKCVSTSQGVVARGVQGGACASRASI